MGTEAGREVFHQDLWLFSLEKKLQDHKNIVIADVRFPNEVDFIRKKGGYIIRIKRGLEPEWYDIAMEYGSKYGSKKEDIMSLTYPEVHISEWAWIGQTFDYVINNEGNKNELEANIKYCLTLFKGPSIIDK